MNQVEIEVVGFLTCAGYNAIKDGKVMRNFYKVSYIEAGNPNWDQRFTGDYFPQVPTLIISNVNPSSLNGTFGTEFYRDITVVNGGFGKLKEFLIEDNYGASIVIDSIRTGDRTVVVNSGGKLQVLIDSALIASRFGGDTLFGQNKTWVLREYIRVVDCDPIEARSIIRAKFGCNYESSAFCDSSADFNANVIFGALLPNIVSTPRVFDVNKACPDLLNDQSSELVLRNNGTAESKQTVTTIVAVDRYYDGLPYSYSSTVIDTTTITIQINNGAPQPATIYSFDSVLSYDGNWNARFNYCNPNNRVKKVQISIPDIKPGDSVVIRWKMDNCCAEILYLARGYL